MIDGDEVTKALRAAEQDAPAPSPVRVGRRSPLGPPYMRRKMLLANGATWGVVATFAVVFGVFSVLRPDVFPTSGNMAAILSSAVIQALIAAGLTFPLIMNDFDLSVGSSASLAGAPVVVLTAQHGVSTPAAIVAVLLMGVAIGVVNGILIAVWNASSFIMTLAMGSVLTGIEFLITGQQTIFTNIPADLSRIGSAQVGGVIVPVFVVAAAVIIAGIISTRTIAGRYIYAVGANASAATIVGLRVSRLRVIGLATSGLFAAGAGILISSISQNYFPGEGQQYLLPSFAAAFLGSALFPSRRFSVVGAAIAAVLLEMVATGLVELNLKSWTINVFNGAVLAAAILTALRARRVAV